MSSQSTKSAPSSRITASVSPWLLMQYSRGVFPSLCVQKQSLRASDLAMPLLSLIRLSSSRDNLRASPYFTPLQLALPAVRADDELPETAFCAANGAVCCPQPGDASTVAAKQVTVANPQNQSMPKLLLVSINDCLT
jgi:hypothetical protein